MSSPCSAPPPQATISPGTGILPAASRAGRKSPRARPTSRRSASRPSTTSPSKSPPTRPSPICRALSASGTRCPSTRSTSSATTGRPMSTPSSPRARSRSKSWEKSNNSVVLTKNATATPARGRPRSTRSTSTPRLGAPEVGLPAFLAGDADYTVLNAGQIPVAEQRFPDGDPHRTPCSRPPTSPSTSTRRRSTTPTFAGPSTTPSIGTN